MAFFYNKIFHEDKPSGLLKLFYHRLEFILPKREILYLRIAVGREPQLMRQIVGQLGIGRLASPYGVHHILILLHVGRCLQLQLAQAVLHKPGSELHLDIYVEQGSNYGKSQHAQHPCHLKGRIAFRVDDVYQYDDSQDSQNPIDIGHIFFQVECHSKKDSCLKKNQQKDDPRPAEYDAEKPFFGGSRRFILTHTLASFLCFLRKYIIQFITNLGVSQLSCILFRFLRKNDTICAIIILYYNRKEL